MSDELQPGTPGPDDGLVTLAFVIYLLHGFSALTGLLSPAFIATAFMTGWPSVIAVILNYVKRGDTRGTWLETHYRWQIRTFWFAVLWVLISVVLAMTVFGLPFAVLILWITGLWVMYRIVRGWLRLMSRLAMPVPE